MLRGELFATDMVRAYQEGRKLHTCRPMKLQVMPFADGTVKPFESAEDSGGGFAMMRYRNFRTPAKAKHRPGDYIYCRETWSVLECEYCRSGILSLGGRCECEYVYRTNYGTTEDDSFPPTMFKWRPSIHMPREAARLFFRDTDTTIMNLDDVDEQFAREDGFLPTPEKSALEQFREFWRSTYGDARWMWVYWTEPCSREEAMSDGR